MALVVVVGQRNTQQPAPLVQAVLVEPLVVVVVRVAQSMPQTQA